MNKSIGTLRQLFEVLCRIQTNAWFNQQPKWKLSARALETWGILIGPWSPLEEKEVNSMFRDSKVLEIDFSERNKVLYLPPLEKNPEFVPVLCLKCKLHDTKTVVRLYVMLVSRNENEHQLQGIGFRLESPETMILDADNSNVDQVIDDGRHDFYHAQLIRSLGWGPPIDCPDWIPETQPSFPVAANCPVTLMLNLLLSLYGKKYCWTFVTEHQIFDLKSYLNEIDQWYKGFYKAN
jgi:hypothetical protein